MVRFFQRRAVAALAGTWLALLVGSYARAQPSDIGFAMKSWQTEHGLPNNNVTAIAQTPDGYLWLGTGNGVVRFDGVRFKAFGLNDGLGSIAVSFLLVDRSGALWVGTSGGGLSRWNGGTFQTWTSRDGLAGDTIAALLEDAEGTLWIGTWTGLSCWRAERFTTVTSPEGPGDQQIQALDMDREGTVWAVTSPGGLFRRQNKTFVHVEGPPGFLINNARSLFSDQEGNLWVGMGDGALLCRSSGGGWIVYGREQGVPDALVAAITEDKDGKLWVGMDRVGLYFFENGRLLPANERFGLAKESVGSIFADLAGNIWVGTERNGLHRLCQSQITAYVELGKPTDRSLSVGESSDGTLWVGTFQNGLYRRTNERFEPFVMGSELHSGLGVYSLCVARNGTVWWGSDRGIYNWSKGQSARAFEREKFGSVEAVRALCEDSDGGIWVGTALGRVLRVRDDKMSLITDKLSSYVTALSITPNGTVWVGTGNGLYRIQNGGVSILTRKDGLLSNGIRTLYSSPDNALWIGTAGGGLSRWLDGRLTTFTATQGLPDNIISQILQDEAGDFWFGCSRGIFRVRQAEMRELAGEKGAHLHPLLFGRADGMAAEECSGGFNPACLKSRTGLLYFTTAKGLAVIDPRNLKSDTNTPRVVVEELFMDGESVWSPASRSPLISRVKSDASIDTSSPITIPPGKHRLEFEYSALGADVPERVLFRYRLAGLEDWVEAGAERKAKYRSIPPGRYRFEVMACNSDGVWGMPEASLALVARPLLWQTWWFRAAGALGLAAIAFGFYEWRMIRHRRAHQAQEEFSRRLIESQEAERKRIAADLHDSLGQDLLVMKNRLHLIGKLPAPHSEVAEHIKEITITTSRTISNVRAISAALRPPALEQIGLTQAIEWMVEQIEATSSTEFATELESVDGLLAEDQEIHLYRIVQEGLNNVVKHAEARHAILELKRESSNIRLSLFDDGRGFNPGRLVNPAVVRPGFGLTSLAERTRLLNGALDLQSSPGRGTRVTVTIPLPPTSNERNNTQDQGADRR